MDPNETQNSEYVQKEPLVYKKTIIKILKISSIVILILAIFIVSYLIILAIIERLNNKPKPIIPAEETTQETKADIPTIAYIKNKKSIWTADINGENKKMVLEIPTSSNQTFSALAWKNKASITYSKCSGGLGSSCSIETYNTETKAISMEVSSNNAGYVSQIKWSPKENYLAYISSTQGKASFKMKSGTVNNTFGDSFPVLLDGMETSSKILFSDNADYVIFSALKFYIIKDSYRERQEKHDLIEVFKPNGVKVDSVIDASDPMLLDLERFAYKKSDQLFYKDIGIEGETKITDIKGSNPEVSFDKNKIAYWNEEGGFTNALLVVYESNRNIHRNILRGILLPKWVSDDKVVGIKAENCLGTNCQLYQFQTNSLAIVDVALATVSQVDQGTSINQVQYNEWYAN